MLEKRLCVEKDRGGWGQGSLACQPLLPKEGERVWSNAYRARVPAHCIVRANQMHGIKSHDCAGMKGMQINDCAHVRSNVKFNFAFLIHTHQKYVT